MRPLRSPLVVASLALAACTRTPAPAAAPAAPRVMTVAEFQAIPNGPGDRREAYGADSSQFGELRLPAGDGPHPVAVLVHGGCFRKPYANLRELGPLAEALRRDGVATWNVEYRRLGEPGGGWPGTYRDVGSAVDHLRALAPRHRLDLERVVLVGHSAGGHLALWAAARHRVPEGGALHAADPLPVRGVVDLAGAPDLGAMVAEYEAACRDTVVRWLMGGTPDAVPGRYAEATPRALVPSGVRQLIVFGEHEDNVPVPLLRGYADAARRAGDAVRLEEIPGIGHFEVASPQTTAWPRVRAGILALLAGRLPDE